MHTNASNRASLFSRAVDAAAEVCRLPAVPTIDWTNRLARSMVNLTGSGGALAMVGSVDSAGKLVQSDAADAALTEGMTRAPDGSDIALTIRSRAERLASVGIPPRAWGDAQGIAGLANDIVSEPTWRDGPLGKLWEGIDACDLLVGAVRLGTGDAPRVVVVQIASLPSGEQRPRFGSDDRELLAALLGQVHRRAIAALGSKAGGAIRWLTSREQQVLDHLKEGKTVRDIATAIDRSQHTVHDHVKSLHRKLNANSRGELVARALGHITDEPTVAPTIRVVGDTAAASTFESKAVPAAAPVPAATIIGQPSSTQPSAPATTGSAARVAGYGQAARLDGTSSATNPRA